MIDVTPKTRRTGGLFDKAVFFFSVCGGKYIGDILSNPDKQITLCSPRLCLNGALILPLSLRSNI